MDYLGWGLGLVMVVVGGEFPGTREAAKLDLNGIFVFGVTLVLVGVLGIMWFGWWCLQIGCVNVDFWFGCAMCRWVTACSLYSP